MHQFLLSCHIIAFTAWMAGLFYLPRLFVYHAEEKPDSAVSKTFIVMEKRLLKIIMNPAMLLSWSLGLSLYILNDYATHLWILLKFLLVLSLTFFHIKLGIWRKALSLGQNTHSAKFYRRINEIPTILLILIVFLVIYKP